jgi:hypothetical protein
MIDTSPFQLNLHMWDKMPKNGNFVHIWGGLNPISRKMLWKSVNLTLQVSEPCPFFSSRSWRLGGSIWAKFTTNTQEGDYCLFEGGENGN